MKLLYSLRLKIKRNDDTCLQAANHLLYFESENELKFYSLVASTGTLLGLSVSKLFTKPTSNKTSIDLQSKS